MTKIPVGKTIARAYSFVFQDFLRILGVMWLPMVLSSLPGILMHQRMIALQGQLNAGNLSALREMLPILLPFYLLVLILIFMQVIGIAKLALGTKEGPAWFYFSLGRPVWRLIGSVVLLIVAMVIGWLAAALGSVAMASLAGLMAKTVNNGLYSGVLALVVAVAAIALWCGYIYAVVRLTFLLIPVIAAGEQGFALARSWTLGLGNFWRIFVILLAVVGPLLVLEVIFVFGVMFRGISFPPAHADAAQSAAFQAALNARSVEFMATMYHYWYLVYPVFIVIMVVFYGAYIGAPCFAYRALTEDAVSTPGTSD